MVLSYALQNIEGFVEYSKGIWGNNDGTEYLGFWLNQNALF